jgi:hypothetical protein
MTPTLKIRSMNSSEVQLALDWAAQEGWNPGLHDTTAFYATDPLGFLIAELNGEPKLYLNISIELPKSTNYCQSFTCSNYRVVAVTVLQ